MADSILTTTKKALGLHEADTSFDADVIMYINSVFSTLNQLGVGPTGGFMIHGVEETWAVYLGSDMNMNDVKTYMYLRVRMLFDPPTTSFALSAMKEQIDEHTWRINVYRETLLAATDTTTDTTIEPVLLVTTIEQ